jgi:hypothetical protein
VWTFRVFGETSIGWPRVFYAFAELFGGEGRGFLGRSVVLTWDWKLALSFEELGVC